MNQGEYNQLHKMVKKWENANSLTGHPDYDRGIDDGREFAVDDLETFLTSVEISSNKVYVAEVYDPEGELSEDVGVFTTAEKAEAALRENVSDYFGKEITFSDWGASSRSKHARFNIEAYATGFLYIREEEIR